MNLNKKVVVINVMATLLFADVSMAKIEGVRTSREGGGSSSSSNGSKPLPVKVSTATEEPGNKITAAAEAECSGDQDAAKHFPLEMFKELTRDGDELKVEVNAASKKVVLSIPPIISACGKFVPEARQNKETKNVTILMSLIGKDKDGKDVSLTYKQFEDCLVEKKILVDGKINHDTISGKNYSESKFSMDYDFDKKQDVQKSVSVTFAYPKEFSDKKTGYASAYGFEDSISVPGEACMRSERVAEKPLLINKGKEDYIKEVNEWCLSGKIQEAADLKKTIGNADALKDIADKLIEELDAGYLGKAKKEAEEIYKNLGKIEDKILNGRDTLDEAAARKLIASYASELEKLNTLLLNPAIARLEVLMDKRKAVEEDDSEEAKSIDKEIKSLNEEIGKLAKRADTTQVNVLYDVMEKYATNDSAKIIEDIIVKSETYSKVYPGKADERGKPFATFEAAQKNHTAKVNSFNKVLLDWNDVYLTGKGSTVPYSRANQARTNVITKMNKSMNDYVTNEQKKFYEYCGAGIMGYQKNPTRCAEFQQGAQARQQAAFNQRGSYLKQVQKYDRKLNKMQNAYGQYRETASKKEAETRASRHSEYEDDYYGSDLSPSRFGEDFSRSSISYNPHAFSMGLPQGQFGVAQNYNQSMIGQGQMMMQPQQLQSAWPGM